MKFRGRTIDPVQFWSSYVEFPTHGDYDGEFSPLVLCPNPNHNNTHSPAFQINLRRPMVHCFAQCGISGSYQHAIATIEGIYEECSDDERGVRSARRRAEKFILRSSATNSRSRVPGSNGGKTSRRAKLEHTSPRNEISLAGFSYLPPAAIEYLGKRGISSDTIATYEIGWDAEERRLVFPVRDLQNRLKFLIKRSVRDKDVPKYLYTEDAAKKLVLYGACAIDPGMVQSEGIVLVEGSIDCMRLHQHGVRTVAATLGTGISKQQAEIVYRLRPKRVTLLFDKDLAGVHGIEIAEKRLRKIPLYVGRYPKGKSDPAELTKEEAVGVINRAIPLRSWKKILAAS